MFASGCHVRVRDRFRLAAAVSLICLTAGQTLAAPPVERARPPIFSKSISDIFFPDARDKLVGSRPATAAARAAGSETKPPSKDGSPGSSAAYESWSRLISADAIEDEIISQQILLTETVLSAAKFKGGDYQCARTGLTVLATMLAIAAETDESVRWQREAPALRDRMARAAKNCKAGTDASYQEAKARSAELENLVRGGGELLPPAAAQGTWDKVADRPPLMKRLEQAHQQSLAPWTANAKEFSRHADKLSQEAQLVAAIAHVIQRDGFEFADDPSYRDLAREMENEAIAVRKAVESGDYAQAREAVNKLNKACGNCHEGYRS